MENDILMCYNDFESGKNITIELTVDICDLPRFMKASEKNKPKNAMWIFFHCDICDPENEMTSVHASLIKKDEFYKFMGGE